MWKVKKKEEMLVVTRKQSEEGALEILDQPGVTAWRGYPKFPSGKSPPSMSFPAAKLLDMFASAIPLYIRPYDIGDHHVYIMLCTLNQHHESLPQSFKRSIKTLIKPGTIFRLSLFMKFHY